MSFGRQEDRAAEEAPQARGDRREVAPGRCAGFAGPVGGRRDLLEGYTVDYRRDNQTIYLPDGDSVGRDMRPSPGSVATAFDAAEIERLVRWAQANPADYSDVAFGEKAKDDGCAGYLVSFLGRRVGCFGRTAETRVEHFPK